MVRGRVVAVLEHRGASRIRASWEIAEAELRVVVRDDGPGDTDVHDPAVRRVTELAEDLGGHLVLDAVPGWGTTVIAEVPLGPAADPGRAQGRLTTLKPRELDVLERLARGMRNRQIAEDLGISGTR